MQVLLKEKKNPGNISHKWKKSEITGFTRVISPLKVNVETQLKKTPTIIVKV
jgi:hypothetical protein